MEKYCHNSDFILEELIHKDGTNMEAKNVPWETLQDVSEHQF